MHRPVPASFGEFTRSVQRIDNPHAFSVQAGWAVSGFFGKHMVRWSVPTQHLADQGLGLPVTGILQLLAGHSLTDGGRLQLQKHLPGVVCQLTRKGAVSPETFRCPMPWDTFTCAQT